MFVPLNALVEVRVRGVYDGPPRSDPARVVLDGPPVTAWSRRARWLTAPASCPLRHSPVNLAFLGDLTPLHRGPSVRTPFGFFLPLSAWP